MTEEWMGRMIRTSKLVSLMQKKNATNERACERCELKSQIDSSIKQNTVSKIFWVCILSHFT